ncbi:hypothetical protein [uncultured Aquimarina sp.]|uniref:hypothetical protein n=1 Tax=uncultured Aquimarina sp. TaxID=575652 RepID=UPI0026208C62|nr:hypothetical protein [uncultured Aquimarina sp.]
MKKVILAGSIILLLYFAGNDLFYAFQPYSKFSARSILIDDEKKDSLNHTITSAEIGMINKIHGIKGQSNRILANVKYNNTYQDCLTENVVQLPYLLLIGTTKKEGDSIDIIYNKKVSCNSRKNAIYTLSKQDYKELKYFKLTKALILLLFAIILTWDTFLKTTIRKSNGTITHYD